MASSPAWSRTRSLILTAFFAVALTVTSGVSQAQTAEDVGIMAAHKSPFNCGKTFYANNWSPGHNPSGAIDWQNYGSDAVGGETVRATASGTARFYSTLASSDEVGIMAYGNYVIVTHGDGTRTRYAHLATMVRGAGSSMEVAQGTAIGTVGGTGGNYAPHLHYEQITSGGALDTSPTVEGVTVSLGQKKAITSTNNCGGNPYSPAEVCGSGYESVDSASLVGGTVHLLYNAGTGYNCVVTLKSTSLGTASAASAFLEPEGGHQDHRPGLVQLLRRTGAGARAERVRAVGRLGRHQLVHESVRTLRRIGPAGVAAAAVTPVAALEPARVGAILVTARWGRC